MKKEHDTQSANNIDPALMGQVYANEQKRRWKAIEERSDARFYMRAVHHLLDITGSGVCEPNEILSSLEDYQ